MIDQKQIEEWRKLCEESKEIGAWHRSDVCMPARLALPQLLNEIDRLNAIINHKIEGYTLRYSVSATGTYDGASAEGKTVEEAVKKLGEALNKLKEKKSGE